jgi:hypothetical protein
MDNKIRGYSQLRGGNNNSGKVYRLMNGKTQYMLKKPMFNVKVITDDLPTYQNDKQVKLKNKYMKKPEQEVPEDVTLRDKDKDKYFQGGDPDGGTKDPNPVTI